MKRAAPLVLFVCLVAPGCVALDDAIHEPPARAVGALAPALALPLLGGGEISTKELEGHHVIVKFWASYCGACGRSAARFADETERLGTRDDVSVISVSLDEDPAEAREAAQRWGLAHVPVVFFGVGYDDDPAKLAFGVRSIPETFWIGPDRRILAQGRHVDIQPLLVPQDPS